MLNTNLSLLTPDCFDDLLTIPVPRVPEREGQNKPYSQGRCCPLGLPTRRSCVRPVFAVFAIKPTFSLSRPALCHIATGMRSKELMRKGPVTAWQVKLPVSSVYRVVSRACFNHGEKNCARATSPPNTHFFFAVSPLSPHHNTNSELCGAENAIPPAVAA